MLRGRRNAFGRLRTLVLPMQGIVGGEPLSDAYDLAPERLELQLDGLIVGIPPDRSKTRAAAATGTTYGTAQPRSARTTTPSC